MSIYLPFPFCLSPLCRCFIVCLSVSQFVGVSGVSGGQTPFHLFRSVSICSWSVCLCVCLSLSLLLVSMSAKLLDPVAVAVVFVSVLHRVSLSTAAYPSQSDLLLSVGVGVALCECLCLSLSLSVSVLMSVASVSVSAEPLDGGTVDHYGQSTNQHQCHHLRLFCFFVFFLLLSPPVARAWSRQMTHTRAAILVATVGWDKIAYAKAEQQFKYYGEGLPSPTAESSSSAPCRASDCSTLHGRRQSVRVLQYVRSENPWGSGRGASSR